LNIFDADVLPPSLTALSVPPNFQIVGYDLVIRVKRIRPASRGATDNDEIRD